jgi:hypothetical protein
MDRKGGLIDRSTWKRITVWSLAALSCVWAAGPAAARERRNIIVDVPDAEAVLYEVTENMYLIDDHGNLVLPQDATRRQADASLFGWARVGNLLCPSALLVTNPRAETCSVTADGIDNLSLTTGKGDVTGTFAVVVQDDNAVDAAEYVVMNGAFRGDMDLSIRPLGKVIGTFTPAGGAEAVKFCGTFRLPFSIGRAGKREMPRRNAAAFYLADNGTSLIPVQKAELSLGMPTVRLELNFEQNCR